MEKLLKTNVKNHQKLPQILVFFEEKNIQIFTQNSTKYLPKITQISCKICAKFPQIYADF